MSISKTYRLMLQKPASFHKTNTATPQELRQSIKRMNFNDQASKRNCWPQGTEKLLCGEPQELFLTAQCPGHWRNTRLTSFNLANSTSAPRECQIHRSLPPLTMALSSFARKDMLPAVPWQLSTFIKQNGEN